MLDILRAGLTELGLDASKAERLEAFARLKSGTVSSARLSPIRSISSIEIGPKPRSLP